MVYGNTSNFSPDRFFGAPAHAHGSYSGSPFSAAGQRPGPTHGSGLRGLPDVFEGWDAASRYSFFPAIQFAQGSQPSLQGWKQDMNKDWSKELFGQSADAIDAQFSGASRKQQESMTRAGVGTGGASVSPLASFALQNEAQARAGAFGSAARQSVLQAQAMQQQARRGYDALRAQIMQAMLAPAQFQSSRTSQVPIGQVGPSLAGPAMSAAGGALNFLGGL